MNLPAVLRRLACAAVAALLLVPAAVLTPPLPAEAQGLNKIFRTITRVDVGSKKKITQSSLRRIVPRLDIVRGAIGPVVGLAGGGGLVLAVLGDGSVRLWDLERGVQLGGAQLDSMLGGGIAAGAVSGSGRATEAVLVRRDGSLIAVRRDGGIRALDGPIPDIDPLPWAAPVLAGSGVALAFRTVGGEWRLRRQGRTEPLPGAAHDARPILSLDGTRAVYRTRRGNLVAWDSSVPGAGAWLGGCSGDTVVTAGAFLPGGERVVLGDEHGGVCVWHLPRDGTPKRFRTVPDAHDGPVRAVAAGRNGRLAATAGSGGSAAVWSIVSELRPIAAVEPASGPLLLDASRRWLLLGESGGTVGIHSAGDGARIASLISMESGWAVIDRAGRFDGPQSGVDSLAWAGETPAETLPVDAFSESWFEPGLLAKLDDARPLFLNEQFGDLTRDGYILPPKVSIDAVDTHGRTARDRVRVIVRVERGYDLSEVSEVRLYHGGKLAGRRAPNTEDGAAAYTVRLLPGENTFAAVGVGPGGIEGPKAETASSVAAAAPRRPEMQVVGVGIDNYDDRVWPRLAYGRKDAMSVVTALRDRAEGAAFADVVTDTLLDEDANAAAIGARILQKSISHHDALVVYLAGHGYALRGESGWEWYFIPHTDAWRGETEVSAETIRRHGLSSRRLMDMLTETQARRVFIVIDSCRSGAVVEAASDSGALDNSAGQKALRGMARVGGFHILAASRANEDAVELDNEPHGALTYLVLEGLRGRADGNGDSAISVREIVDYAVREMPLLAARLEQSRISQKPVGYSRGADFALAGIRTDG